MLTKDFYFTYFYPTILIVLIALSNCSYNERGHANTPPENPGSQVKTGVDTFAHPGNIDRDSIHPER